MKGAHRRVTIAALRALPEVGDLGRSEATVRPLFPHRIASRSSPATCIASPVSSQRRMATAATQVSDQHRR